jgi:membrane-associated protein
LFFRRSHLQRAHEFYEKFGGRAVILARFVPIVRTFCPPVAGAAQMRYSTYLLYDIFGGALWISSMLGGGYVAGSRIPNIGQYLHFIIAGIIFLSILPPIIGILRSRRSARQAGRPAGRTAVPEVESK